MDRPRSIAALFATEADGISALEHLHDAGFKNAWLGVTRAQKDHIAFSEVVRERGGGLFEEFVRFFSGGDDSLYTALMNHHVVEDVARHLSREMPEFGVVVIAGWTGDMAEDTQVLERAGGTVVRGADGGVIGTPRPRLPDAS